MSGARWYPTPPEVSREMLVVILGAIGAAVFFAYVAPGLGRWVAERLPTASRPPES